APGGAPATPAPPEAVPEPTASPATASNMVKVKADIIEYDRANKIATAKGNVDVRYQGAHITSEFMQFDQGRDTLKTDRDFVLTQADPKGTQTIKGSGLAYNVKTKEATVSNALLNVPVPDTGRPVFVSGKELRAAQKQNKFNVAEGIFSTCEEIEEGIPPHYHVTSRALELVQDDYALGWDSWIYVNNRRLFWVPFLWLPLKKRETSVQFGQNDVEGFYVKTSWGYRLNPQHSGTLLTDFMQKKGPGLGVKHQWTNIPTSLSLFETYGLAQSDPNPGDLTDSDGDGVADGLTPEEHNRVLNQAFAGGDPLARHGLDRKNRRPFDDYWWRVRHQQRLLDTMTLDVSADDSNIYTVDNARATFGQNLKAGSEADLRIADIREDRHGNQVSLTDQRFGANYTLTRTFREDRNNKGTTNGSDTKYSGTGSWSRDGTSVNLNGSYNSNIPGTYIAPVFATPTPAPGGLPLPSPSPVPRRETTNTSGTLTVSQALPPLPGSTSNSNLAWSNTYSKQVNPSPQPVVENLDEKLAYTADLGWGDFRAEAAKKFRFEPQAGRQSFRQAPHVDELPELELKSKPILGEYQPFTLAIDMGRYFDSAIFPEEDVQKVLTDSSLAHKRPNLGFISRAVPRLELNNKAHEMGFRSTLDFGGTAFEQRFYGTGDQAYNTTLKTALGTQYTDWWKQTLTYSRVMPGGIDEKDPTKRSNTPFQWDRRSLSKETTLNGAENFEWKGAHARGFFGEPVAAGGRAARDLLSGVELPGGLAAYDLRPVGEALAAAGGAFRDVMDFPGTISWTHNLGYDYERLRYSDYRTSLTLNPSGLISVSVNSSYHFKQVPHLEFKGDGPDDIRGKWNTTTLAATLRTTEQVIGGNWGMAKTQPGGWLTTSLNWEPDTGKVTSLTNELKASFGESWDGHWELGLAAAWERLPQAQQDPNDPKSDRRAYRPTRIAIARDLHDFILSLSYERAPGEDRSGDRYLLKLHMTALNFDILSIDPTSIGAGNLGVSTSQLGITP
ncbi:MAG: LPS-assembly protein LptD, partial [Candidatus Sericytochromatia bacterium]|nr:LPS-assembly protein LptD [Candidatus Tanganyikabacteria bacterium]